MQDIRRTYRGDGTGSPATVRPIPFWTAALASERYRTYISSASGRPRAPWRWPPPGSTTIVCLPTGQGKTEVAMATGAAGQPAPGRLRARRADRGAHVSTWSGGSSSLLSPRRDEQPEPQRPLRLHRRPGRRGQAADLRRVHKDGPAAHRRHLPRGARHRASAAASPPRPRRATCSTSSSTRPTWWTSGAVTSGPSSRPSPASG